MGKRDIEDAILNGSLDDAKRMLEEYESEFPLDVDLISLKLNYYLLLGQTETALKYALLGVERLPMNAEMYYNLASVYEFLGQWLEAYVNYQKAVVLSRAFQNPLEEEAWFVQKSDELLQRFCGKTKAIADKEEVSEKKQALDAILALSEQAFGFRDTTFRSYEKILGSYYYEDMSHKRYVGIYKNGFLSVLLENEKADLLHEKGELLEAAEGFSAKISDPLAQEPDAEYLLPIACDETGTEHMFVRGGEKYSVFSYHARHFDYYRVKNYTEVYSNKKSYYGNPIPLGYKPGKKKLVLNIFVDGLCQKILRNGDFERLMPYTYHFFKKGLIFTNAYSAAEWTAPSLANYVTGLYTTHHMLTHNKYDTPLPKSTPLLSEYFQKDGYYTAQIGGDWRMTPVYGYLRGIDRYIYQHQNGGYAVTHVLGDVIDHLEAFREVNQYLWINIGDLHDVADEFPLPIAVQKELALKQRTFESRGQTSVKQNYSLNKQDSYKMYASYVDARLHMLYSYLEEHYGENELVVSLFADHGQGYFVKPEEHFLADGRSNVAFMFRGGIADGLGECDEPVSTIDYGHIMRKLADIQIEEIPVDGQLPRILGGNSQRDYAFTESIHPGDIYQAAIHTKDGNFYFKNPVPVTDESRFQLAKYSYWWEDLAGNRIEDEAHCRKYLNIVLNHIAPILIY